jgi:hypothetical protein
MAETRTRGAYRFANHDAIPAIPRDTLTSILKYWDDTADPTSYLNYFTADAVLKFGGEHRKHAGIRAARDSMIHPEKGPIVKCQHFFENGFILAGQEGGASAGEGKEPEWEIIGVADVRYTLVGTGEEVWTRAASWAKFVQDAGEWKAKAYEVFMDGSKLFEAMSKLPSAS